MLPGDDQVTFYMVKYPLTGDHLLEFNDMNLWYEPWCFLFTKKLIITQNQ